MKMFYTAKELSEVSEEELSELVSFEGAGTTYYYSNLDKVFTEDDEEFCIRFKDSTEIFTKDLEVFNRVRMGKSRFDLLTKSLEQNNQDKEAHGDFYKKVSEDIKTEMANVHSQIDTNRKNFDNIVKYNKEKLNESMKEMEARVDITTQKMESAIKRLNDIDTEKFEKLITQVEKITEAFSELLED